MTNFQTALKNFADFFAALATQRQILVGAVASSRQLEVLGYLAPYVVEFERARQALLMAAGNLDRDLATLRTQDNAQWLAVIAELNALSRSLPGAAVSSTQMRQIVSVAVPAIPPVLLEPVDSMATRILLNEERARYAEVSKDARLGALFLAVIPVIPKIVTGLVAIAAIVGATVIATSFFSQDSDAYKAQADVLKERNKMLLEGIPEVLKLLPEKDRAAALNNLADFGADPKLPPRKARLPWWGWLAIGGVALYAAWPYIGGAVTRQGSRIRASYGVAGMRRRPRLLGR